MIAVDTSTLIAFLDGDASRDTEALDRALASRLARLPPVVVTEILSAPDVAESVGHILRDLPALDPTEGYWERAGRTRSRLLARRLKAPLADTLICQSCLDYDLPLLTRDRDFEPFARHCGLRLA